MRNLLLRFILIGTLIPTAALAKDQTPSQKPLCPAVILGVARAFGAASRNAGKIMPEITSAYYYGKVPDPASVSMLQETPGVSRSLRNITMDAATAVAYERQIRYLQDLKRSIKRRRWYQTAFEPTFISQLRKKMAKVDSYMKRGDHMSAGDEIVEYFMKVIQATNAINDANARIAELESKRWKSNERGLKEQLLAEQRAKIIEKKEVVGENIDAFRLFLDHLLEIKQRGEFVDSNDAFRNTTITEYEVMREHAQTEGTVQLRERAQQSDTALQRYVTSASKILERIRIQIPDGGGGDAANHWSDSGISFNFEGVETTLDDVIEYPAPDAPADEKPKIIKLGINHVAGSLASRTARERKIARRELMAVAKNLSLGLIKVLDGALDKIPVPIVRTRMKSAMLLMSSVWYESKYRATIDHIMDDPDDKFIVTEDLSSAGSGNNDELLMVWAGQTSQEYINGWAHVLKYAKEIKDDPNSDPILLAPGKNLYDRMLKAKQTAIGKPWLAFGYGPPPIDQLFTYGATAVALYVYRDQVNNTILTAAIAGGLATGEIGNVVRAVRTGQLQQSVGKGVRAVRRAVGAKPKAATAPAHGSTDSAANPGPQK